MLGLARIPECSARALAKATILGTLCRYFHTQFCDKKKLQN